MRVQRLCEGKVKRVANIGTNGNWYCNVTVKRRCEPHKAMAVM